MMKNWEMTEEELAYTLEETPRSILVSNVYWELLAPNCIFIAARDYNRTIYIRVNGEIFLFPSDPTRELVLDVLAEAIEKHGDCEALHEFRMRVALEWEAEKAENQKKIMLKDMP